MYQLVPPATRRGARGPAPFDRVNLRDVARQAGVSPATASRVFSGTTAVRAETRSRVLEAADQLGYVVNSLAQAMVGVRSRSLAVVAGS
ncbi:MAG: LacI family DNA-binding transcriptional regulator, partial [Propionibacteriaceae bacterium]|nr:LacI family DNA-binding transcriptional regulator [Propionibacteriaceae bacterium]